MEKTLLLTNGRIYTMDTDQPTATTLAISGGKVLAVGGDDLISEFDGRGVEQVDLDCR